MENDNYSNIKINDNVRIITSNSDDYYKILNIDTNEKKITTNRPFNENDENCFVYGSKVSNFHTLDKNYIYTLNVGATQELYKMITSNQSQLDTIKDKLNNLTNKK
jgi:hypothetical protein